MNNIISEVLEIFKYILPALIVFMTAYHLMKKYLNAQVNLESLKLNKDIRSETLPLKLQAYERIMLLCERMTVSSLSNRLRTSEMRVDVFRQSMIIAVQQEFDHNVSQQIFVSDPLWQIVQLAKNEILNTIISSGQNLDPADSATKLLDAIRVTDQKYPTHPIDQARAAIKKEVSLLF